MKVHVYHLSFKIFGVAPGPGGKRVPGLPDYDEQAGQFVVQLVEPVMNEKDLENLVRKGEEQFGQPRKFKGEDLPTTVHFQHISYLGYHENKEVK